LVERQPDGDEGGDAENDQKRVLESFPRELEERRRRLLRDDVDAELLNTLLDVFGVAQQT